MAHILVVDDDDSMLNFLTLALKRAGHTTQSIRNGLDAFECIKSDPSFDLLLTDIVMPGIDGIELAQKASELRPNLKVMFVTGFAAMAMKDLNTDKAEELTYLTKPFHLNDLVNQVETILNV